VNLIILRSPVVSLLVSTGLALGFCIWRGIVASSLEGGRRKGKNVLLAGVSFGLIFCFGALIQLWIGWGLPIFTAAGRIVAVQVHARSHSHPSDLQILDDSGHYVYLHASDGSPYFQPGQRVAVRYQNASSFLGANSLIDATFFAEDRKKEGRYRDTGIFSAYWMMGVGLFFICGSFAKYRRDPDASEKPSGRLANSAAPTTLGLSTGPSRRLR
jgi:hypothetical protein